MRLAGLQKLTLLDYPDTVACTLFTCGCNFRCPFCHNAPLLGQQDAPALDVEQVLDFLDKRRGILQGVVITGGEPLLHEDIGELLVRIKRLGYAIKLDTNGSRPALLKELYAQRLIDYVAMDIKHAPQRYALAIGTEQIDMDAVTESKDLLLHGKGPDYEFRTTVVQGIHTPDDMVELAKWIAGAKRYFLQQFRDSGQLLRGEGLSPFSPDDMRTIAQAVAPYVPSVQLRGI